MPFHFISFIRKVKCWAAYFDIIIATEMRVEKHWLRSHRNKDYFIILHIIHTLLPRTFIAMWIILSTCIRFARLIDSLLIFMAFILHIFSLFFAYRNATSTRVQTVALAGPARNHSIVHVVQVSSHDLFSTVLLHNTITKENKTKKNNVNIFNNYRSTFSCHFVSLFFFSFY